MVFAILEAVNEIQLNEKLHIFAGNSFTNDDNLPINSVLVKVTSSSTPVEIYEANIKEKDLFLAHMYTSFDADITSENNLLKFEENGVEKVATLTVGEYSLNGLLTEIKSQMDSVGDNTYTLSLDYKNKITIEAGSNFGLKINETPLWQDLGFVFRYERGFNNSNKYVGDIVKALPRQVSVTVSDGTNSSTATKLINVYSKDGDMLASNDGMLVAHEPDIMRFLPVGTSTFNYAHREAQRLIFAWLDENGFVNIYRDKFTPEDLLSLDEIKEWSKFLTLKLLYNSFSNSVDDIFSVKASHYEGLEVKHRSRAVLRIDVNHDGKVDIQEQIPQMSSLRIRRS